MRIEKLYHPMTLGRTNAKDLGAVLGVMFDGVFEVQMSVYRPTVYSPEEGGGDDCVRDKVNAWRKGEMACVLQKKFRCPPVGISKNLKGLMAGSGGRCACRMTTPARTDEALSALRHFDEASPRASNARVTDLACPRPSFFGLLILLARLFVRDTLRDAVSRGRSCGHAPGTAVHGYSTAVEE